MIAVATSLDLTATIVPHPSAEVQRYGFDLDDPYLERCWLPVLGPTSVLLLRRLRHSIGFGDVVTFDAADLSATLGLGSVRGRHAPLWRTLERLASFRFASWAPVEGRHTFSVFEHVPPLGLSHLARVPESVRDSHDALLQQHLTALASEHV